MKLKIKQGSTSQLAAVFIQDSSATDGSGLTGLAYNSSGLTWYWFQSGDASATQVTPATATVGTWASGGFVEVDATNMPGVYEIGIPDAAINAAGITYMMLKGATNMAPVLIEIECDEIAYQSATQVTADLSAAAAQSVRTEIDSNSTQLTAILEDTGTSIPALVGALNDLSSAEVNAACDTAIADAALATAAALATVDTVVDNIQLWTHRIATKEFGVISNAASANEQFVSSELGVTITFAGLDYEGNRTGVTFS